MYIALLEQMDTKPMLKTLKQPEFRWPVVGDGLGGEYQWSEVQWSLLKTLAEMRNQHSKSVLIRLYVSPDDKNSSYYVIKVSHEQFTVITVYACMFFTFKLWKICLFVRHATPNCYVLIKQKRHIVLISEV